MNHLRTFILILGFTNTANAADCLSLNDIDWMLGDWTTAPNRVVIHEHWQQISDATFEGESTTRSVGDGEVVNYESLRLVQMSGQVFYIAKVAENEFPVPFLLTQCSEESAVFENFTHDAPQRLVYTLTSLSNTQASLLEVRLEGEAMKDFSLIFHRP